MSVRPVVNEFPGESPDEAKSFDIFGLLARRGWLIILAGAIGAGVAYVNFSKQPPVYQSNCSLLIVRQDTSEQISVRGIDNETATPHPLLVRSPVVVDAAIKKFQLNQLPGLVGQQNIAGQILSGLSATNANERGTMLQLTYRGGDAVACEAVLSAVVSAYKDFLGTNHDSISRLTVDLITDAKDSLMEQLSKREADYQAFRAESPLLWTASNGEAATNIHKERLAEIEAARSKLIIERSDFKAQLNSLETAIASGGNRAAIQLLASASARNDNANNNQAAGKNPEVELFPMLLEEQMLLETLGTDHPKLASLQRRIRITKDFLLKNYGFDDTLAKPTQASDFLSLYLESLRHRDQAVGEKLSELDKLFENERDAAKKLTLWEVKDVTHRNDIARIQQLFNGVVKRLDEINLLKNSSGFKLDVISPPTIGLQVAPVFSQFMSIGIIIGTLIGVVIAYLVEINDKSFRNPNEISAQLGIPIIGHIPVFPKAAPQLLQSKVDGSLVAFSRPKSRMSEAYRGIRTALYFSTRGEQHKVIQVTSPNPGDGKSTMSANLAVSVAQTGKRVLLVDADFRRPRVHKLFGLDNKIGINSVITGEVELPDAIHATEVNDLYILPCGPKPNNPCELLTSRKFDELLSILREQYDFVIIDTPPILAVTDPSAVAARVDGVLLTIRISKRTRSEALRATEILSAIGANMIGVIVNGVGGDRGYGYNYKQYEYGANYGYGYSYRYGAGVYYVDEDGHEPRNIGSEAPAMKS